LCGACLEENLNPHPLPKPQRMRHPADKANGIVRHVTELRASDSFRFPGESRAGTK